MRKAYSLIEAVVAVGVLTIVISVGVSIIFVSSDTDSTNRDLLIANGLAAEGSEAMKNIYYTNILKYGEDDALDCSLVLPGFPNTLEYCVDKFKFFAVDGSDTFYRLSRNYSQEGRDDNELLNWVLKPDPNNSELSIIADGDLDSEDAPYRLNLENICSQDPCKGNNIIGQIYSHTGKDPTKFYREIQTRDTGNSVYVSSRVHWLTNEGTIRTVENSFELPK